jgi:hypothetical protein
MRCASCGFEHSVGMTCCGTCGTPLSGQTSTPQPGVPVRALDAYLESSGNQDPCVLWDLPDQVPRAVFAVNRAEYGQPLARGTPPLNTSPVARLGTGMPAVRVHNRPPERGDN